MRGKREREEERGGNGVMEGEGGVGEGGREKGTGGEFLLALCNVITQHLTITMVM